MVNSRVKIKGTQSRIGVRTTVKTSISQRRTGSPYWRDGGIGRHTLLSIVGGEDNKPTLQVRVLFSPLNSEKYLTKTKKEKCLTGRDPTKIFAMRLPEWLVKAGARLEGDKLFFDEHEVEYKCHDIKEGEIPVVYQVRHYFPEVKESGEKWWNGFSCGLDLVADKELVWISGAYFDTFREAFEHWRESIRRKPHEGTHFILCEDHQNLVRYADQNCWCRLDGVKCNCDPNKVVFRPSTIKLED